MQKKSASRDAFVSLRLLVGFIFSSVGVFLALLALSISSPFTPVAQAGKINTGTKIMLPERSDISPAMRDVDPWPVQRVQEHEAAENPYIATVHQDAPDTVVQKSALLGRLAPSIPAPILNFPGIPYPGVICNCAPPDTNGEVGQTQYVQMVNEGYQVFDKTTGASVFGPASIPSIWSGFGGVCQTSPNGDPVVVYDQLANRWVITEFAGGLTHECVAVSTTNDATGTYARYDYNLVTLAGSGLYDYPHFGVWPDAYYMSMNVFNSSGTAYLGPQGFAFNRTKMLAGDLSAEIIAAPRLSSSNPPMLPADLDGATLPPAGAPNPFVLWPNTGSYRIYHYDVGSPFGVGASFTLFGTSPAAPFSVICPGNRNCVPHLGGGSGDKLDAIGDRLMFRLGYRKFSDHESLVGNFTVSNAGAAAPRWFELRNVTSGTPTTFQESTYAPDSTWRWMGSIAMNGQGDMALGYSASSSTIFPQIRYTGRLASDPLNTLPQGEAHLHDGTGAQTDTVNRWGDYSDMTVDPVDDCTFWYTQEYYDTTSSFNWRTRIGSFRVGTCGGGGGATLVSAASRLTHGGAGTFDINMPLSGSSGVEDRDADSYLAIFTFDTAVTSGSAMVVSGTATAGTPTFSGMEMRVPLTGVDDEQIVTIKVSNVNGGTSSSDVPFGFLTADANANRVVDKPDFNQIKGQLGLPVTSANFRDDVIADGTIVRADAKQVKTHLGNSIP